MKLNPDCIRDILLDVENKTTFNNYAEYTGPGDFKHLKTKYNYDETMYHIRQCEQSGLFMEKVSYFMDGGCIIKDLSPQGHEFLANIRQDNNWIKTKEIAGKIGSSSLDVIKDISSQVISNLISGYFSK